MGVAITERCMMKAPIGFTLIFHVAIIAFNTIKSRSQKRRNRITHLRRPTSHTTLSVQIASIFIQVAIFSSILAIGIYSVAYAINDRDSTITLLKHQYYAMQPYVPTPIEPDQNHIIIRIDDVQAHTWSDISMRMIEDTVEKNMKASLGIISHDLNSDHELVLFLKKHRSHLDFTFHGWGEGDPDYEFETLTREEADYRIHHGLRDLRPLTKHTPSTFIPPNNIYSQGTHEALIDHGFVIVSSRGTGYFDYTAKTYDFDESTPIPNDVVIEDCIRALDEKNLCVIMIHPQDFASGSKIDEERYTNYLDLLERISTLEATTVTFEDYARTFEHHDGFIKPSTPIPSSPEFSR